MGQVIKYDFSSCNEEDELYEKKLIRIRDEIEDYLKNVSIHFLHHYYQWV